MSSRSPSGVASLRARFEQKGDDTSPPSRGRSPAGSVTSCSSRPLSKVRTSFVAVEPSGDMASELSLKGLDGVNEAAAKDGTEKSKPGLTNAQGVSIEKSNEDDNEAHIQDTANPTINVIRDQPSVESTKVKPGDDVGDATNANPDKPVSTLEGDAVGMPPADTKDKEAVSDGAVLAEKTPGLGSILKGSEFEEKEAQKSITSNPAKPTTTATTLQPAEPQSKAPSATLVNGKLKEIQATRSAPSQPPKTSAKAPSVAATNGKIKEAKASKPAPDQKPKAAPAPIETRPAVSSAASTAPEASKSKPEDPSSAAPHTPQSATAPGKKPLANAASPVKTVSPKAVPSKEPKKDVARDAKKPVSRPSAAASKPAPIATASTAKPIKKSAPTSPAPAFPKPKPKSPTRPVRLPASATAPTTASAAKLDGAPPSTGDRRPRNMASVTRHRATSNPKPAGQKTARASLPAGSKPIDKPKAPKSRVSMASTQAAASGGFLERMMRPTQSSAQKAHEKVEPKSPPTKAHPPKPKRQSEGSERSKSEHGSAKGEQLKEAAAEAEQPAAGPSEVPSTNGANNDTNTDDTVQPAEVTAQ